MYPYTAPVHSLRHLITFAYVQTNYTSSDIHKYVLDNFWLIKITQFLLSLWQFLTGGDPFPGVYMRDIPALLRNGFRMSRPKFVSATLWVAVIVKQVVRVVQTATPVMLNFSVPPPSPLPLHCISVEGWGRDYYFSYKHRAGRDRYICFGIPKLS